MTTTTTPSATTIDVREIPPRDRHPLIFSTFAHLPAGGQIELVNDHDPKPLYYQFQAEHGGTFGWQYEAHGPDVWRVRITKLGGATCCGTCGG